MPYSNLFAEKVDSTRQQQKILSQFLGYDPENVQTQNSIIPIDMARIEPDGLKTQLSRFYGPYGGLIGGGNSPSKTPSQTAGYAYHKDEDSASNDQGIQKFASNIFSNNDTLFRVQSRIDMMGKLDRELNNNPNKKIS